MKKPILAITMGDPAGVGPELCLRSLRDPALLARCTPVVFGNADVLERVAGRLAAMQHSSPSVIMPRVDFSKSLERAELSSPTVVHFTDQDLKSIEPGSISATTGSASFDYIRAAIELAVDGRVDGIVTCPIHKEAFAAAGAKYPGHTEMLADLTGCKRYCMMLTSEEISCSLVTCHVGLAEVASQLDTARILEVIELTYAAMSEYLSRPARIAVCGLNPHAGEHGLFGKDEEGRIIEPAVVAAREQGIEVTGPLAPDTAFVPAMRRKTDAYVCMYHDQGLIPLKALAFDSAINVTLGLPIVRSSVDHGTALDIAWKGKVEPTSFEFAVRWAAQQAANRRKRFGC